MEMEGEGKGGERGGEGRNSIPQRQLNTGGDTNETCHSFSLVV